MPDQTTIHTGGGPAIDKFSGTYIGRDQVIVINGYNGADLDKVLGRLVEVFAGGQASLQTNISQKRLRISAPGEPEIVLSEAAARDLLPAAARLEGERAYLAALQVNPRYARWAQQFVPLSGQLSHLDVENDLPPEFSLLLMEGSEEQHRLRRVPVEDINQTIDEHSTLSLLGEPGAGKTTTLRRLALDYSRRGLQDGCGQIPLEIPLAEYQDQASVYDLVQALAQRSISSSFDLTHNLRQGNLMLLFDALNEMPFANDLEYRRKIQGLRDFIASWPGNRMLFTCRSRDYSEPLGLVQVEIERLSDGKVKQFLDKYLGDALADETWGRLEGSELLALLRNPYYLLMFTQIVQDGGDWPASRAGLFRGFVTLLLGREKNRLHPDWPGEVVLANALSALAAHMQPLGRGTRLPRADALAALPRRVPDHENRQVEVQPQVVYRLGLAATLLDIEMGSQKVEQVRFYHHQLQEFFAARFLLDQFATGQAMDAYWRQPVLEQEMPLPGALAASEPLPPPPTTRWEEPTVLAAGLAGSPQGFVSAVRAVNPVLAARCLTEPGMAEMADEVRQTQGALLSWMGNPGVHLRARLSAGEALGTLGDPRFEEIRVDGARLLLPDLVPLPGGSLRMGSTRLQVWQLQRSGFFAEDERPRQRIAVEAFRIGRYPLTNAEYRCFLEDGGYRQERYWNTSAAQAWLRGEEDQEALEQSDFMQAWRALQADRLGTIKSFRQQGRPQEEIQAWEQLAEMSQEQVLELASTFYGGRQRSQPYYWDDPRFNNPSQPVVGVTWFEARAYCAWLTQKLADGGYLENPAMSVRLPTEAEWEYTARGGKERVYPWGRRFDRGCANTYESHLLRTSPVGCYPSGVSAHGLHDLSGNVWEWTASLYRRYPYDAADGREDENAGGLRVVRGGSWYGNVWYARCASRHWNNPPNFNFNLGFRVVLSLADSDS